MSIKKIPTLFTREIWSPSMAEKNLAARFFFIICRMFHIVAIEFQRDAIPLRASALTFTVVLSMVPFLAMGTAVLKGLGAGDKLREAAYTFIDQLAQEEESKLPEGGNGTAEVKSFSTHLRTMTDTVFDYVDNTNFAALGAFGLVGMLFSVISLFGNIEAAMNIIWRAPSSRPLGRKVMDYLALLILLPFAVNVGLAAMTFLQSPKFVTLVHKFFPAPWIGTLVLNSFIFFVIASTFTAMYRFLPNTKVPFLPAITGGVVGALGWLLTQAAYIKLQIGVAKYNAIYGSFATLPLFLLWLYAGWVVFLVGAEVSFAAHTWPRYRPRSVGALTPMERLALAVDLLVEVVDFLKYRRTPTLRTLSRELMVPETELESIVHVLGKRHILKVIDDEESSVYPTAIIHGVGAFEVAQAVLGENAPHTIGGHIARESREAIKERLWGVSIGGLLANGDEQDGETEIEKRSGKALKR